MARIVIVDDEPLLLGFFARSLRSNGYDVIEYTDSLSAYEAITKDSLPIDLIITDVTLKPITGFELIKRVRMNNVRCPVIFMSGYHNLADTTRETIEQCLILEKPFNGAELRDAVQKLLTREPRSGYAN